ncbi:MAG: biotin--[acetyl-CoA-carboxylase] ligase [Myxococcota bacterium]|nr:biotin--[acetyl-CoA-carboxylase] ligase [Myxococcota bacterium]
MKGIHIRQAGIAGVAEGTRPDLLRNAALCWAVDIDRFGPWSAVTCQTDNERHSCWTAAQPHDHACVITGPCTSSLDVAWHFLQSRTLSHWDSVLTLSQRAGRGQLGRDWYSPPGNIYGAWHLPAPPAPLDEMLSLLVGFAMSTALADLGLTCRLKWPNDLLIDDKKVGGILVEKKNEHTIAGIGLNLATAPGPDRLREPHAMPAGCLDDSGGQHTPLALWLALTSRGGKQLVDLFEQDADPSVVQRLTASMAYLGTPVTVLDYQGGPFEGTIVGLTEKGWLKVLTDGRERHIRSGSIIPLDGRSR